MYANVWSRGEKSQNGTYGTTVYLSTWDSDGNRIVKSFQNYKPHLYYEAPEGLEHLATATSMYGKPLIKKEFITQTQRKKWCEEHPTIPTYENLSIAKQFLLNRFHGHERDDDFAKFPLKIFTIDIEIAVNSRNTFPEASDAAFPINLITLHDSSDGMYHVWYMPPNSGQQIEMPYIEKGLNDDEPIDMAKRDYRRFESEKKMLADFMYFFAENRPDVLTGWNISAYDMPYIYKRSNDLLGALFDVNSCLSPCGNCFYIDDENVMAPILRISGVSILDYMYMYKFKFEKGKSSYALDAILDDELGIAKLDHSEYRTFYDFYTKNFSKYVEYNIMDVERVVRLDKKKKFIDLTRKICNLGLVDYESIYHTQPYVQGALIAQAKYDGKLFLSTSGKPEPEGGFKGAYVHDTKTGFYNRGGYTYDLNSLYPNIMNTLNCSPETKAGTFRYDPNDSNSVIFVPYTNDKEIRISIDKFNELLETKFCKSENNVLYLKHEIQKGIMPKFLEYLYTERRNTKNKMLECDIKINELRTNGITEGEEVEKLKVLSTLYNNTQQAYKILLNSVYGLIGLRHYCCFDKDNAEAVTQTGQKIIKTSLKIVGDLHKEMLNYTGEHPALAGDTDSIMNNGEPIYNHLWGNREIEWTKEEVAQFKAEANKICDSLNHRIEDFVHDYFKTSVCRIEFKLETVFSHACFLKRKHYIYRMVDKEGSYMVGSPKQFKMTGLDIKRNQIPKPIRKMLNYCVEHAMLESWTDSKFQSYMREQYEEFKKMSINDIALQFAYRTRAEAVGFLQMAPRAHITAKVSTFYNQMIEKLEIANQKPIHLGDAARYVYIKPDNPYGINVMGFNEEWPPEFDNIFEVDYRTMFEKVCLSKIEGFINVFGWHNFDPVNEDEVDIFAL